MKNSKNVNPNLKFDTPYNFKRKLESFCGVNKMNQSQSGNLMNDNSKDQKITINFSSLNKINSNVTSNIRPDSAAGNKLNIHVSQSIQVNHNQVLPKINDRESE